jgi:heterodisulfide reductase subunit B
MRVLLQAHLDTDKTNDIIRSGKMPQVMQEIMEAFKPEASYFTADNGVRTMFVFFDMQDPAQMPPLTEPLFEKFGAEVDYTPVMNLEDVQKGLSQLK